MNKNLVKVAKYAIPAGMVLLPLLAFAVLPTPKPPFVSPGPGETGALTLAEAQALIEKVARFMITVAVVIAVIALLWGGILWVTSGGDETRQKKAKAWFTNGLWGALIILAVGVIIQTLAGIVARTFFG